MKTANMLDPVSGNPFDAYSHLADRFMFSLGAPSYVWKGGYAENVEKLSSVFNVIQLLVFEPFDDSYDIVSELEELERLKRTGLRYVLHLPLDSYFGGKNENPLKTHLKVIEKVKRLDISKYILHVEKNGTDYDPLLASERIKQLIHDGGLKADDLCVEYLNESFDEIWKGIEAAGVSVCMDIGHVLHQGRDPVSTFDKYKERIKIAHIHGSKGKDHRPLSAFPRETLKEILGRFENAGSEFPVIIENHSVPEMLESLGVLDNISLKKVVVNK